MQTNGIINGTQSQVARPTPPGKGDVQAKKVAPKPAPGSPIDRYNKLQDRAKVAQPKLNTLY